MKKFVSILLAVMLVASLVVSASAYSVYDPEAGALTTEEALEAYHAANPDEDLATRTYYFQMPNGQNGPVATQDVYFTETDSETGDSREVLVCQKGDHAPSWFNDYTEGAGVYWWGGPAACESWAGYKATVVDADQCIYSAVLPKKTVMFIFNNGVDGGMDKTQEIFYKASQTVNIAAEYPDPGEYPSIPEGAKSFDGMIYIVNPDTVEVQPDNLKMVCGGTWYFYYGDGCYGSYATDSANFKSVEENCVNPDHFDAEGNHVGHQTAPAVLRGDYDGDGKITIMDATRVQNIIAELYERPEEAFLTAVDADGDGKLTIMDATRIQNFLAELMNMDGTTPYVPVEA